MEKYRITAALTKFLKEWSDTIPLKIIHGGKFKVRVIWWYGVCGNIYLAIAFDLIGDEVLKRACESFLEKFTKKHCWGEDVSKRTTKEDVDEANALIERMLKHLSV